MTGDPTLFDMQPLAPAEVVRRRGWHPVSGLALLADEAETCGGCAERRWVWVRGHADHHVERWELACSVVAPDCLFAAGVADGPSPAADGSFCDDDCCTAECCAASADDLRRQGYSPHEGYVPNQPWPWPSAAEDWMPACVRWRDLDAERALMALRGDVVT